MNPTYPEMGNEHYPVGNWTELYGEIEENIKWIFAYLLIVIVQQMNSQKDLVLDLCVSLYCSYQLAL